MSVERAQEFLQAAIADPAFRARMESAGDREAALVQTMQTAGYGDVTVEDLQAAVGVEGELSDADLERAAGGAGFIDTMQAYGDAAYRILRATVRSMIP